MKIRFFILSGLIALAVTSCNINGSSNSTPEIYFVTNPFVSNSDTLNRYRTDDPSVFRMDTIHVGDTVTFRLLLYGYTNNLTNYYVTQSDTSSTKVLLPTVNSLDSVFMSSASDYSKGKFVFKSKITSLYFPFKYIAKKVSNDAKISFSLVSDANFSSTNGLGNSSVSFVLTTPIKARKVVALVKR